MPDSYAVTSVLPQLGQYRNRKPNQSIHLITRDKPSQGNVVKVNVATFEHYSRTAFEQDAQDTRIRGRCYPG